MQAKIFELGLSCRIIQNMRMCMVDFARKIREIRRNLGMSQAEFANFIGASQGSISKWESGREKPRSGALLNISEKTGYNVLSIVSGREHHFKRPGGLRETPIVGNVQSFHGVEDIYWSNEDQFNLTLPYPTSWQELVLQGWIVKGKPNWPDYPPGTIVVTASPLKPTDDDFDRDDLPSGFAYEHGDKVLVKVRHTTGLYEVTIKKVVQRDDEVASLWPLEGAKGDFMKPVDYYPFSGPDDPVEIIGLICATFRHEVPSHRLVNVPDEF